eukprot:174970-Pyramimonas_sp.AAC.1
MQNFASTGFKPAKLTFTRRHPRGTGTTSSSADVVCTMWTPSGAPEAYLTLRISLLGCRTPEGR